MIMGEKTLPGADLPGSLAARSDEELLRQSQEKNYGAFEELVKRYEGRIYRLGLRMLHSPQDAEDLLQKTFLSVFESMGRFRGESRVSTWIFRIATNHALMKLRKDHGRPVKSLDSPDFPGVELPLARLIDEDSDISLYYEKKEFLKHLEQAVVELPDIYRLIFILRDVEGFSNGEVAQMLDLSVPAVKSRVLRARMYLRDSILKSMGKEGDHVQPPGNIPPS